MEKKILIIDDSLFFIKCIEAILEKAGYAVLHAATGAAGLHMVAAEKPDLVLLDVVMPDMSGFDVCRILRESESNNLLPIIMLTSQDHQDDKLIGLDLGADDYITKPFDNRELLSRVKNTLTRIDRNRHANPLTGLQGNLEIQAEINSRITMQLPFAVIYADLDHFKSYNDVYGFAKGDIAIKMTADILVTQVRDFGTRDDFIGHIGGDDFVIITLPDYAEAICTEIIYDFDDRIQTLYTPEDLAAGCIYTLNRAGKRTQFPIMTISLAIITNEKRTFASHVQVAEVAAELKREAKLQQKSNFVRDRRALV
ncbi:MAG: diguanylate cyclase protein [Oscillospiraceae bacterium]|nr:diguanylate cyclase protein [Oscillospiraceae bacterium]